MFGMQLKITIHAQNHIPEEIIQPIKTKPEMKKMMEIGERTSEHLV